MAEEKAIEKVEKNVLAKPSKSYTSIIDYAKDMTCSPVTKTNCKLCNSIHRKEAEEFFAEGKSPHFVWKWLKTKGEELSDKAVHNHYVQHYQRQFTEIRVKAYAENLEDYSRIRMGEEERLTLYSTLLDQQIHVLGSIVSQSNPDEMRKGNETLIKLIDQAVKVQKEIKSLRQDNEPVKILVEKLNNVMTIKWEDAKSTEAKEAIKEILDVIVKEVEAVSNVNK